MPAIAHRTSLMLALAIGGLVGCGDRDGEGAARRMRTPPPTAPVDREPGNMPKAAGPELAARGEDRPETERLLAELMADPAPLRDWKSVSEATRRPGLTRAQEALLALEESPQSVGRFVVWLPSTPDVVSRVAVLYEANKRSPTWSVEHAEQVHLWLMAGSDAYEGDLRAAAAQGLRPDGPWGVSGQQALEILQRRDASAAAAIYERLAEDREPSVRAYALVHLYGKATGAAGESLRARLKMMAADPSATVYERDTALGALSAAAWEGDVEWYLSLFHDASLRNLEADRVRHRPLVSIVAQDPDAWIPRLVPLVGGPDRAAHDNAVQCLVAVGQDGGDGGHAAREDALRPLLPWVLDPAWSGADDRLRVLQSLKGIATEDQIPALVACLDREGTFDAAFEAMAAAKELGRLRARAAIPALRAALTRAVEKRVAEGDADPLFDWPERDLLRALLDVGGMEVEEQVRDVEAFAAAGGHATSAAALRGRMLATSVSDEVAARILARAAMLDGSRPEVAAALRTLAERSSTVVATRHLLDRLGEGTIDSAGIRDLLRGRVDLRETEAAALRRLARADGFVGGVAAVLLMDPARRLEILRGGSASARRALLACARVVREPLPMDEVMALLGAADPAVAEAADRFLEAEDSPKARAALRARAPKSGRILGLRPRDPGGKRDSYWSTFDEREEAFRREVLGEDGPDDVFALLSTGTWGGREKWVVRHRGTAARVTLESTEGSPQEWTLPDASLATLLAFIRSEGVDDLPSYDPEIYDGIQYEYVHVARAGGVRVFMNNPGPLNPERERWTDVYSRLVQAFEDLRRSRPR